MQLCKLPMWTHKTWSHPCTEHALQCVPEFHKCLNLHGVPNSRLHGSLFISFNMAHLHDKCIVMQDNNKVRIYDSWNYFSSLFSSRSGSIKIFLKGNDHITTGWGWMKWLDVIVCLYTSLVALMVKCLPTMQETWVQPLGQEDPLEKKMATHSSILAWKIPWTEEPGRLHSKGSQREQLRTSLHFNCLLT